MQGDRGEPFTQAAVYRAQPPGVPPAPPGAPPGPPAGADPVAYRGRLLKAHLRRASWAYRAALAAGLADPVVVIAERADPRTSQFPAALLEEPVGSHSPVSAASAPILVFAVERARALVALHAITTRADDALDAWRPGTYLAVVAGAGGLTFSLVSLPPRRRRQGRAD